MALVPFEAVELLGYHWLKATLYVVVNSQVLLDHVIKVKQYMVRILLKKSVQFAHRFKLIEVLLEVCIHLLEGFDVLL